MEYVNEKSDTIAREMRDTLASLPKQAGVIFVSVQARPTEDGNCNEFRICLGVSRDQEEGTGHALVRAILAHELQRGLKLHIEVFRGVSGAFRTNDPS